jgi:hypothetical protein
MRVAFGFGISLRGESGLWLSVSTLIFVEQASKTEECMSKGNYADMIV